MQVQHADGAAAKVIRDTEGTLNILESGSAFLREATTVCKFGLWDPHRSDAQFHAAVDVGKYCHSRQTKRRLRSSGCWIQCDLTMQVA